LDRFETTHWSVVQASQGNDQAGARDALERLCQTYWRPIFAYLKRAGHTDADAEDLTQQFLAELLARDGLSRVHPRHGRFRSFLLASLRNFLSHQRERARARKRGGGVTPQPLATAEGSAAAGASPTGLESPEVAYDRQWARMVLEHAQQSLHAEYAAAGRSADFRLLADYLPGGEPRCSQAEVALRLGTTVSAVKSEVHRLRLRYGQYLRAEIAATVTDPAEVDAEIRHLLALFARPPHPYQAT
jgi:RNA polymerase sigma-70 factor (ECF subfamily)